MAKGRYGGRPGGMGGSMGGGSMQQAIKQAQKMQEDMQRMQQELAISEFEASSGGGMVTAKINGEHRLVALEIKPEAVDPDDVEMLQDMVLAAVNAALDKLNETTEKKMSSITGGMNIPGMF